LSVVDEILEKVVRIAVPESFNVLLPTVDYFDGIEDVIDWIVYV
jgi:hypothetical protein